MSTRAYLPGPWRRAILLAWGFALARAASAAEPAAAGGAEPPKPAAEVKLIRKAGGEVALLSEGKLAVVWRRYSKTIGLQTAQGRETPVQFDKPLPEFASIYDVWPTLNNRAWVIVRSSSMEPTSVYLLDAGGRAVLRALTPTQDYVPAGEVASDDSLTLKGDGWVGRVLQTGSAVIDLAATALRIGRGGSITTAVWLGRTGSCVVAVDREQGFTVLRADGTSRRILDDGDHPSRSGSRSWVAVGDGSRILAISASYRLHLIGADREVPLLEGTDVYFNQGYVRSRFALLQKRGPDSAVCLFDFESPEPEKPHWLSWPEPAAGVPPGPDRSRYGPPPSGVMRSPRVVPTAGGTKAWVMDYGPTGSEWYLWDLATRELRRMEPLGESPVSDIVVDDSQTYSVVRLGGREGYVVMANDGTLLQGGKRFFSGQEISMIEPIRGDFKSYGPVSETLGSDPAPVFRLYQPNRESRIVDLGGRVIVDKIEDDRPGSAPSAYGSVVKRGDLLWVWAGGRLRVHTVADGRLRAEMPIDSRGGLSFWPWPSNDTAWFLIGTDFGYFDTRGNGRLVFPVFGGQDYIASPGAEPGCLWVNRRLGTDEGRVIWTDLASVVASVTLGGVDLPPPGQKIAKDVKVDRSKGGLVKLDWFGRAGAAAPAVEGRWELQVQPKGKAAYPLAHGKLTPQGDIAFPIFNEHALNQRSTLVLTYYDNLQSKAEFTWPDLELKTAESFWKTEKGGTVLLWLVLLAVLVLSQLVGLGAAVSRYAPVALTTLTASGATALKALGDWKIDLGLFGVLVVGTIAVAILLGGLSPRVLRRLAGVSPFDRAVPAALALPALRKRYFAEYVTLAQDGLANLRKKEPEEKYVVIPARLLPPADFDAATAEETSRPTEEEKKLRLIADPARLLTARLSKKDAGCAMLLVSPGGRGKSALLHEIVDRALTQFTLTGRTPIPIICDQVGENLLKAARAKLGPFALPEEAFRAQVEAGYFLLVIDGLSDRDWKPLALQNFLTELEGEQARLLCSTRPNAEFEEVFRSDSRRWLVEPQRLDETTVGRFEENYLGAGRRLPAATRAACQGRDGTYLPVLVRLAAEAAKVEGAEAEVTVAGVYRRAFDVLMKDPESRQKAAKLCVGTYWKNGQRVMPGRIPDHEALIKRLLAAGVLIPTAYALALSGGTPVEVKFFHDTMQGFLTAEGLMAELGDQRWDCLLEAAGRPDFISAQSDLMNQDGSELFQMCVHVFMSRAEVRRALERDLRAWAGAWAVNFSARMILTPLSEAVRDTLHADLPVAQLLTEVVTACGQGVEEERAISRLARLYMALAPIVYRAKLEEAAKKKAA